MRRFLTWAILMGAIGVIALAATYSRDTSGSLRKDAATIGQANLIALEHLVTVADNMDDASGAGLTYTRVKVDQAGAGIATLLTKATGKTARLHALVGTMGASGTVTIAYDNDGAGTSAVALTGNMPVAAYGGMVIPFNRDPASALASAAGKQLTLVTTGGAFDGYAVVSTD